MKTRENTNKLIPVIGAVAVAFAVLVSLFARWEPSGETWYYWFFSRVFAETGRFCIPDRSPVYTLYLELFRWMGYPLSVTVEYFATTMIALSALVVLFRRYFKFAFLLTACILWIPLLQVSEPPVQKLALACLCIGAVAREGQRGRFQYALSYALLILAVMFRTTYVVALGTFLFWDVYKMFRDRIPVSVLMPRRQDWPVPAVLFLAVWFQFMQSPHPWNGASPMPAQWSPANQKSLKDASFVQYLNRAYISKTYGSFNERDWYFTNREFLGGASTMAGAIKANPKFVAGYILRNIKGLVTSCSEFTLLPGFLYQKFPQGSKWWYPIHLFITLPVVGLIFYGAFRGAKTALMRCFLVSSILILATTVFATPGGRYFPPFFPIVILSTSFYLKKIEAFDLKPFLRAGLAVLVILLFSNGTKYWVIRAYQLGEDIFCGQVRVLEARQPYSMKASKANLDSLTEGCSGIMSIDNLFLGSFTSIPTERLYSVMEIPPFGSFGNSSYDGLRPNRVDCILTNYSLPLDPGAETNARMRYDHYIEPYVRSLEGQGAVTYEVPTYGYVTVLKDHRAGTEGKDDKRF